MTIYVLLVFASAALGWLFGDQSPKTGNKVVFIELSVLERTKLRSKEYQQTFRACGWGAPPVGAHSWSSTHMHLGCSAYYFKPSLNVSRANPYRR